tara:strand:+ start:182 stop:382 length:201 start_codon:yes stop_codon:yes gene_type:complete
MNEFSKYEKNCILSALEIARLILADRSGEDVMLRAWTREDCLDHLDISDEEAEILEEKINILLGEG